MTSTTADHVIGGFSREALSSALASTHRMGFGPQTRVIDGARGDVGRQLERIGLRVSWKEPPGPDAVLIVVHAPGRSEIVADLFCRLGADFVVHAERRGSERLIADAVVSLTPDARIGEGGETRSEA